MKILASIFYIGFFVMYFSSCSNDTSKGNETNANFTQESYNHSPDEMEALALLNEYRVSKNLPTLQVIEHISFVASTHNDYMIANNTLNHDNFEERQANMVTVLNAYKVGENVASGHNPIAEIVAAWTNSNGHKNVIEGDYTHFGIAITTNAAGKKYLTNIFIKK